MRYKLYKLPILKQFLIQRINYEIEVDGYGFYVYRKSKYRELIHNIIKYSSGIDFERPKINDIDQQAIYSPFMEMYDVEMECSEIIRLVFTIQKE